MEGQLNLPVARRGAWELHGTNVREATRASEALAKAGLDWNVEKRPLFMPDEPDGLPVVPLAVTNRKGELEQTHFATVRSNDRRLLGIVGPDYKLLQNSEAFDFLDALVDDGDLTFETAGQLRGGRWVWLLAKMPRQILIGGADPVDEFLLFFNSHDGTRAITVAPTSVRVICQNTLNLALQTAARRWSLRHTNSIEGRLQEAREALGISYRYFEEFEQIGNRLIAETFTEADFERFLLKLEPSKAGEPTKVQDGIRMAYHTSTTVGGGLRETKWGALNVVGEYFDHLRNPRNPNSALMGAWFGDGVKYRDRALSLLTA